MTAGLLSIEGAHVLEGDAANVDALFDAGFRMISPAHFFDTEMGGSAHGVIRADSPAGRDMVRRWRRGGGGGRLARLDPKIATSSRSPRGPLWSRMAASRFRATPGETDRRPAPGDRRHWRADRHRVLGTLCVARMRCDCAGDPPHRGRWWGSNVALGSDFDGGVPVPFDATGIVQLTEALLADGVDESHDPQGHGRERVPPVRRGVPIRERLSRASTGLC